VSGEKLIETDGWREVTNQVTRALSETLTLAFLGSASSGKDAAIKALFGVDFGEIDPIPGSTKELRVVALDAEERFLVINAPGFGDINSDVDQVARDLLESLDLVVYVVNADGGATRNKREDLRQIQERCDGALATLVCINKIDLIRSHQREMFVASTLDQLGVDHSNAVVCAFDPMPQISQEPIGLQGVIHWIESALAKEGKNLIFAKHLRNKGTACLPLIHRAAKKAAAAGALPVPGVDMTAVAFIQVLMVKEIASVHGVVLDQTATSWLVGELLSGTSKGFIRWAVQALKAAGWLPGAHLAHFATSALGASIAAACTHGIGHAAIRYLQSGQTLPIEDLRTVFNVAAHNHQNADLEQNLEPPE
jgi:uncharacterized protein (DUF697 family)/GTP-binding protein EngB required for normal cell division